MLEANGINLYYGASHALRDAGIKAEAGKITCVLGRNGVGKTSLMRALVGLQPVRSGSIIWEGEDIAKLKPHERARRGIAMVPQGREIFPRLTVQENLETGMAPLKRADKRIDDEIFALFPILHEMRNRRGGDLSGGQQQQLAIGRALVTRPRLLLLDEPTEGIQPSIIKDIGRVIRELANRGTMAIVLVEQYFDFARALADSFVLLQRGEVVVSGSAEAMDSEAVRGYLTV
ncbi:urea ABC transporter ATP-binding subunit UrtE [Ferrovibrio sp.]|uniref:urea ABC transporter ATP-binding subunit UrtE n=1 Tax=Ferrovibrio sp. TaxID=1917215 RepID=UPI0035B330F9